MKMRYRTGDVLFREGDPSDFACLILEGAVEVRRAFGDESLTLGVLETGDLVGEMGVLENQPRSATVIARGDVAVEIIAAEGFVDWICRTPEASRRLLVRLSAKVRALTMESGQLRAALRRLDQQASLPTAETAPPAAAPAPSDAPQLPAVTQPPPPPVAPSPPKITLRCLGAAGDAVVKITRLPFCIGRRAPEAGLYDSDEQLLLIPDAFPYRLSPNHFAVCMDPRLGLVARDLGSDLGTTVNGQFIGGIFAKDTCRLQPGVNTVAAGGLESPFVFKILVE